MAKKRTTSQDSQDTSSTVRRKTGQRKKATPQAPTQSGRPEAEDGPAAPAARKRATAPKPGSKPRAPRATASRPRKPAASRAAGQAPAEAPSQQPAILPDRPSLHVVMVASEARPFATSGGLAEMVGSLSEALAGLGHRVTVIIPRYSRVTRSSVAGAQAPDAHAVLQLGSRQQPVQYYLRSVGDRMNAVFVDVPELFDRDGLYGTSQGDYPDNAYRFAVFSRAALEYLRLRGERPSVIHTHDWQAGLVPAYQKMLFSDDPVVGRVPAVFTIHNLAFQGIFPASTLSVTGLPSEVFHVQAMEFWGQISYLKAGINFSERITTVSPGYAREALAPETGFGFDGVLARRADEFAGILNGIDTARWNPSTDPLIPATYTVDDLSGKAECRRALLESAGLDATQASSRPVIAIVSRMTDQKGFDLLARAADELMALDAAWVVLGNGETVYEELWKGLAADHPGRVSFTMGYDEAMEHRIEAGADLLLMPSRFEPCGLNQLNSLRYGTIPVVRATGGLDDTVEDVDPFTSHGTGFKFVDYTPEALLGALRRSLEAWHNPDLWRQIQRNAMSKDYSWDVPAREYVKVYSGIN